MDQSHFSAKATVFQPSKSKVPDASNPATAARNHPLPENEGRRIYEPSKKQLQHVSTPAKPTNKSSFLQANGPKIVQVLKRPAQHERKHLQPSKQEVQRESLPETSASDVPLPKDDGRKLYISGLKPGLMSEAIVKNSLFKDFIVETTSLPTHIDTAANFAFVTLTSKAEALRAIAALHGTFFCNCKVTVALAKKRS